MTTHYTKYKIELFGAQLIRSGDLDPVYLGLRNIPQPRLKRWLVAYWLFYHAGLASFLAEKNTDTYWSLCLEAARNLTVSPVHGRWPRGKERRHFRGDLAVSSVRSLIDRYHRPEDFVNYLYAGPSTIQEVSARVQEHRGFGPWMGFKAADMIERCLGWEVSFDNASVFMFRDPTMAALKLWKEKMGLPDAAEPKNPRKAIEDVVNHLMETFKDFQAPPSYNRTVNIQEIETVLCKWKSHMNGSYPLNHDLRELLLSAGPWTQVSVLCGDFLSGVPKL